MARETIRAGIGPGGAAVAVRLPRGRRSIDSGLVRVLDDMKSRQRISTSNACTIVFFKAKGGKLVAAQRCDNRKLKAHNRKQCRSKKKQFVRCARRR